jgi:hypothetical protein
MDPDGPHLAICEKISQTFEWPNFYPIFVSFLTRNEKDASCRFPESENACLLVFVRFTSALYPILLKKMQQPSFPEKCRRLCCALEIVGEKKLCLEF